MSHGEPLTQVNEAEALDWTDLLKNCRHFKQILEDPYRLWPGAVSPQTPQSDSLAILCSVDIWKQCNALELDDNWLNQTQGKVDTLKLWEKVSHNAPRRVYSLDTLEGSLSGSGHCAHQSVFLAETYHYFWWLASSKHETVSPTQYFKLVSFLETLNIVFKTTLKLIHIKDL